MANTKRRRRRGIVALVSLLVLVGGYFVLDRLAKVHGYNGAWDFISGVSNNYLESEDPSIAIEVSIDAEGYAKLVQVREEALVRGVIVQPEDPYVRCEIEYDGKKVKAEIRLKGKMTDHVEGSKWSFRIKTRKGDALLGMKRFSLQHPGTRNYVYERVYHQLSEEEGLIALRYHFVNLTVNGDDLGVYALEEHFGQEIAANNGRVAGPIFRFNPNLFWHFRVHELKGLNLVDEYTRFQSSYIDPFNESKLLKDNALGEQFGNALALIESFRRGEVPADAVFDVDKLARRYAILDVIGGQHSADWSDLKFYFNPDNAKIEPISYESFSGRGIYYLLGQYKYLKSKDYYFDFHNLLFSDEAFFRAYIGHLKRLSTPDYLHDFFARNDSLIKHEQAVLHSEFPYKDFDSKVYFANAELIRGNLNIPQFFHAYCAGTSADTLLLQIGSIESMPAEISFITINDTIKHVLEQPLIVNAKASRSFVAYTDVRVVIPTLSDVPKIRSIVIGNQLLGGDDLLTTDAFLYEHVDADALEDNYLIAAANIERFEFLTVDEDASAIVVAPGVHVLDHDLVIPAGFTVYAGAGTEFVLNNSARIISRSSMQFSGAAEQPIQVYSSDSTGQGFVCLQVQGSKFTHVQFHNLNRVQAGSFKHDGVFNLYRSKVSFDNCEFYNIHAPKAIYATASELILKNSTFGQVDGDGVEVNFGTATIQNTKFNTIGDKGLLLAGGTVSVSNLVFTNIGGAAILVKEHAKVQGTHVNINNAGSGVEAMNDGELEIETVVINQTPLGFSSRKKGDVFGPSKIVVTNVKLTNVEQAYKKNKSSVILVDGVQIGKGEKLE